MTRTTFLAIRNYQIELIALLVVTIWGTNFVFQKIALAQFEPLTFTFLRFLGMLALSWGVLWLKKPATPSVSGESEPKIQIIRRNLPRLLLAAFLGYTVYIPLWVIGLNYTTAFSSALLIGTAPVFTVLLLGLFRMEILGSRQWLALGLALFGLLVFAAEKLAGGIQLGSLGDLISLISALAYAGYLVANKPLLKVFSPTELTAYAMTLGAIPVLLLAIPTVLAQNWSRINWEGWLTLGWSIIFPVYLAWTLWNWVNAEIGVARSTTFMYLVPLIGGICSWLLLGENFGWLKIGGALLILSGLIIFRQKIAPKSSKE